MSRLLNFNVLSKLECVCCKNLVYPPIWHCQGCKWPFCLSCFTILSECPQCKHQLSGFRALALEKFITTLSFPCKYRSYGCPVVAKTTQIKEHELICEKIKRKCPLAFYNCLYMGGCSDEELINHLRQNHLKNMFETNNKNLVCLDFKQKKEEHLLFVLLLENRKLFRIGFEIVDFGKMAKWMVEFLPDRRPQMKATNNYYEITINKIKIKAPCIITDNEDNCDFNQSVMIGCDMLKKFCYGNDLHFKVKIIDEKF